MKIQDILEKKNGFNAVPLGILRDQLGFLK